MTDPAKRERAALDVLALLPDMGRRADLLRPRDLKSAAREGQPSSNLGSGTNTSDE